MSQKILSKKNKKILTVFIIALLVVVAWPYVTGGSGTQIVDYSTIPDNWEIRVNGGTMALSEAATYSGGTGIRCSVPGLEGQYAYALSYLTCSVLEISTWVRLNTAVPSISLFDFIGFADSNNMNVATMRIGGAYYNSSYPANIVCAYTDGSGGYPEVTSTGINLNSWVYVSMKVDVGNHIFEYSVNNQVIVHKTDFTPSLSTVDHYGLGIREIVGITSTLTVDVDDTTITNSESVIPTPTAEESGGNSTPAPTSEPTDPISQTSSSPSSSSLPGDTATTEISASMLIVIIIIGVLVAFLVFRKKP